MFDICYCDADKTSEGRETTAFESEGLDLPATEAEAWEMFDGMLSDLGIEKTEDGGYVRADNGDALFVMLVSREA